MAHRSLATDATPLPLRASAIGVVLGIAAIHVIDLAATFRGTPYLGYLSVALIAACVLTAYLLAGGDERRGWALGGALAVLTLAAYFLSRTVGLPGAADDIGNWGEPLGLLSIAFETTMVLMSASILRPLRAGDVT